MAKTSVSSHEKVSVRLAEILIKLNRGEKLDPRQLAEEFGVTLRTIQRDLLNVWPICRSAKTSSFLS